MDVAPAGNSVSDLLVSPLQMALATAAVSNNGILPPARIALSANTPQQGWVILPALGTPKDALPGPFARETAQELAGENPYWSFSNSANDAPLTWFLAGTLPDWSGSPLALVVLLEEDNSRLANQIGKELLTNALEPEP
jgi:hypothetical protein